MTEVLSKRWAAMGPEEKKRYDDKVLEVQSQQHVDQAMQLAMRCRSACAECKEGERGHGNEHLTSMRFVEGHDVGVCSLSTAARSLVE
jgi:hypothetical protein